MTMKASNKLNITVLLIVVCVAVFAVWYNREPKAEAVLAQQNELPMKSGPKAGLRAPSFSLQGTDGTTYVVDGPRDKAVILNFWASWCDPCQQEAPELNTMATKYKDVLDIYGINVSSQDYKPNAERFIKKYGLVFPVMFDVKDEVYSKYNGAVFPTNVLIDKNGVISEIILGILSPEELEEKIIKLTES
ncbi:thiol-disulfide isomerase/thioredoxin [Paenibacillus sp. PastF-4]|uniref:TlpA family protein disulfide reductase n=2 Tax=Paenibacillus TaxID=44249 RepID=UPI002475BE3B|nr:TlpA disulfide reductase family protein [Paenibacillus sp. PastF-4]MDH6442492.1 thiol-disulfide isomerase/thioredoxin [Paenibacillus sp. PastF-4]